eukprot:11295210-Ditylum_brightwellii.AAC.1
MWGESLQYGGDISKSVIKESLANISMPGTRPANADSVEQRIWEKEVDKYVKQKTYLCKNIKRAYMLVYGQYLSMLVGKIEGTISYPTFNRDMDVISLLAAIRGCIIEFDSEKKKALAIYQTEEKIF